MAEIMVGIPWGSEKLSSTTRKEHILGQMGMTPDSRVHRFGFSDGAVTAGKLLGQKAPTAAHDNDLVTAAAAAGATTVTVTLGATLASLNQYEDGILYVNDNAGEGQLFRILSNPAAAASATLVLTLHEKVITALTSSSQTGLIENPYKDVVINPATTVGRPVGWTNHDVADNSYFWMCSKGDVAALIDGTVVLGESVMPSNGTAGAVEAYVLSADIELPIVGTVTSVVNVTTDYGHIYGNID